MLESLAGRGNTVGGEMLTAPGEGKILGESHDMLRWLQLAIEDLADDDPSTIKKIFLYSHPPIKERIAVARAFAAGNSKL